MKAKDILIPIDVAACPLNVFSFVNESANRDAGRVTLLYVSRLNVVSPENRLYAELETELRALLARLKAEYVDSRLNVNVCVRAGKPAREIVARAAESKSDLIVLTGRSKSRWKRLFRTDIANEVIATAPCPVCVLHGNKPIDCTKLFGDNDATRTIPSAARTFQKPEIVPHPAPAFATIRG